jgi:hypothetical protein
MYIPKEREVHHMVLHFNVKGESRKAMVKAIEKEIGGKAKYLGVPSCAYEIGNFTVGKNGELEFGDFDDLDEVAPIVDACVLATGVSPAEWENNATEEENADTGATEGENEPTCDGVSISVPRDGFTDEALENLHKLVESKAPLMKKAFLTDDLPIIEEEDAISFPWFSNCNADSVLPYTKFIAAICDMAKNQKRITAKPREDENEKYAFRCFLLRLGFIGDEYKADRKVLLANLSGSSAFKVAKKEKTYRVELDGDNFKTFTAIDEFEAERIGQEIAEEYGSEYCLVEEVTE